MGSKRRRKKIGRTWKRFFNIKIYFFLFIYFIYYFFYLFYLLSFIFIVLKAAIEDSIQNGRGGKGSIYVWASGNGRRANDNCNYDGYANSRYTIPIGSVSDDGRYAFYRFHLYYFYFFFFIFIFYFLFFIFYFLFFVLFSIFSEPCSAIFAVTPRYFFLNMLKIKT